MLKMSKNIILHLPINTQINYLIDLIDKLIDPDVEFRIELLYTEYIKSKVLFFGIFILK